MYNYSLMVHSVYHTGFLHIVNVGINSHAVHITVVWGGGERRLTNLKDYSVQEYCSQYKPYIPQEHYKENTVKPHSFKVLGDKSEGSGISNTHLTAIRFNHTPE